jgi:hypothetical protein
MANIKNFGIVGVGAGVQFGKGGAQLIQTTGTFAAKNAAGNAFVRFQIADGASDGDAVTFNQLTNAVSSIGNTTTAIQTELDAVEAGAGLGTDGSYVAPVGSNYLANATTLKAADALLDAAIFAEATTRAAADSALSNAIANAAASTGGIQAELDQVENSVGLGTDGTLTLAAGNYLGSATDLVNAIETLDGVLGDTAAIAAEANSTATQASSDVANALGEITQNTTDIANVSTRVDVLEANETSVTGLLTGLRTDVDSNSAILAGEITRAEAAEGNLSNSITTEVSRATAAEGVLTNAVVTETSRATDAEGVLTTAVVTETSRATAAEGVLTNAVVTETSRATSAELALGNSVAAANAAIAAEVVRATGAEAALDGRLTTVETDYINKDGTVAMTGALDMGNNVIHNVSTPVDDNDAANKAFVTGLIAGIGNAFNYKGTVAPGVDAGNATVLASTPAVGDYYKATSDGYLIGADDGSVAFHVFHNDGVVRNTDGGWDTIGHTDSTVAGTSGEITVTGTVDTGYVVGIDATYTAARHQEVTDEANARAAADATLTAAIAGANAAVATETTRAMQAESDLTNSVVSETSRATTAEGVLTNAVVTETSRATAAEGVLTNAVVTETSRATAAEALIANSVSTETARAEGIEAGLRTDVDAANAAIIAEVTRAEGIEAGLRTDVDAATAAVGTETARAEAAEAALANSIASTNSNVSTLSGRVDVLEAAEEHAVSDEANARIAADNLINANVAAVASNVANAQSEIDSIETGAGLDANGHYVANTGAHYIATATSLFDADNMLDNAVAALATELATLSQDTIKTEDGLNSVHVADGLITTKLDVAGTATVVSTMVATANTNTALALDFSAADEVKLAASGTSADVDLRLTAQGSGHVIIGETGVGVIQADDGYDMTIAGGTGANLNLQGTLVNVQDGSGTNVAVFAGVAGATAWATVANGNTAVTFGAAGAASNLDLVFAPKGGGVVNMSSARVINVANATASTDAVNKGQLDAALSTASVGVVKTVVATLPATSGSVTLGTITGTVLRVRVLVSNTYDAGSTIVVGNSTTANDLAADTDIDEGTAGIYVIETAKDYSAITVTATVTNTTGLNGAAKVIVEYLAS